MIDDVRYRAHPNYRGQGPWYDFVKVRFQVDDMENPNLYPDDNSVYPAKIVCFYRQTAGDNFDPEGEEQRQHSVLAHCAAFHDLGSSVYGRKTLLTRSWLYDLDGTAACRPKYTVVGTVETPDVIEHVFGIEENPGFFEHYRTEVSRRFIVVSDMRKDWPRIHTKG